MLVIALLALDLAACNFDWDSDVSSGDEPGNATVYDAGGNGGTITACCWSGEDVERGVGEDDSIGSGTTYVDGSTTKWTGAQSAMNDVIGSDVGWKYDGASDDKPPTLVKSRQGVRRMSGGQ